MQYCLNDPYYPTLRQIGLGEPDVLFFSVYIWNSSYIRRLVGDLVNILPDTPIILGGPQAEALARNLPLEVYERCSVVSGEIEGVERSFYRDLQEQNLQRAYTCRKVNSFHSPYRQEDFTGPLQNRYIYYESSRGCPFNCTYCLSASEKGIRHLPVSQVEEEIKEILLHKPKVVRFVDRTFNDRPDRALEIWRVLAEQPGDTLFHFEMAPDRFTNEMFEFLQQVGPGRFQFEIGVQSTNPETLEAINRKCDLDKLEYNIPRLAALDTIHLHLDLILGLPYETGETYARSFADVFALGPHYIQMGLLKILPDTPISQEIENFGLLACEDPPYEIIANRWLDKDELEYLYWFGECVEAFYNNRYFRCFWQYLRKSGEDIFAFFQELLEQCRIKKFFDLAKTQELLSSLLLEVTRNRQESELSKELLIFDWLRCGHHFLPDHFETEPVVKNRNFLWKNMEQNLEGIYDYKTRDEFFKQGVFFRFSGRLLQETGLSDAGEAAYVCFRPKRENTVFRLNSFILLPKV
jgi:radical SAM superfamily enzyme YgiQ (UPF0313 family)